MATPSRPARRVVSLSALLAVLAFLGTLHGAAPAGQPNILWITSEDHGPQMGCYGDPLARTPNVDALAAKGMLYRRVWSGAPVCAPARTTIVTGMFAPSLGAEHMRSEVAAPAGMKLYPELLREAGYYTSNNVKTDYNVVSPSDLWDALSNSAHWRNRPAGRPFFAVFNSGVSHEGQIRKQLDPGGTDPAAIRVPAYHPDTPEVRRDWARYYSNVTEADAVAGGHLKDLAAAGLADDTIVFYYADHGSGMPRSKRWPSNSGLHVPLVVYFPPKWRHLAPSDYTPGGKSDRLVSFVDLAPTALSLAGVKPPAVMQGRAFAGSHQVPGHQYLHGFRGRMDERYDLVRSVTDGRYVYLRNFMPHLSQGQHVGTQFQTPTTQVWRKAYDAGRANDAQSIFWREPKAPEELYDLQSDPDEVKNLAASPAHRAVLERLRGEMRAQAARVRDLGFLAEAELHARSGLRPPRDVLATDAAYDFPRIFAAAEVASLMEPSATPQLRAWLSDPDSGVRYWGAMGARMRGRPGVQALHAELVRALDDASASVRIAAAGALALHGEPADLPRALNTLQACADPTKTSAYAGVAALNVIDELGDKAKPLVPFLRDLPTVDPHTRARGNDYVHRLRAHLLTKFGESPGERKRRK